jgi:VWFA-related protein
MSPFCPLHSAICENAGAALRLARPPSLTPAAEFHPAAAHPVDHPGQNRAIAFPVDNSIVHLETILPRDTSTYLTGMRYLLILTFSGVLLAQAPATQPAPQDDSTVIKVDVDVVNLLASVRDKHGALVANLEQKDFSVFEDGKLQPIKYFTRETDLPLTIGLLIDVSASQRNLLGVERSAAIQFFSQVLRKKDEAFLIAFGEESELLQDYTNSVRLLTEGLNNLKVSSGVGGFGPGPVPTVGQPRGTVLYDAIYVASTEKLRTEVGRKVIVVITDGVDEGSKLPLKDALEASQKADAVVYSVEYSDPSAYGGWGFNIGSTGDSALHQLSDPTGGRVYRVGRNNPLEAVFKELSDEMRSQYSIGYTPLNPAKDGSYRKLEIRMANKDLKAQARKGYYAIKPETR